MFHGHTALGGKKRLTLLHTVDTHVRKHMPPRAGTWHRRVGTSLCHHVVKAEWIHAVCCNLTDRSIRVCPDGVNIWVS